MKKGQPLPVRKTARETLRKCGRSFEITTYTQSRNLLSDIADDGYFYDLLLLDIEMPELSGMGDGREDQEVSSERADNLYDISSGVCHRRFLNCPSSDTFLKNELETRLAPAVAEAARADQPGERGKST